MVISCCAVGCTHRQGCKAKLAFYRIPADEDRRRRWLAAINRENWKPSKYSRICSEHFLQGEKSDDPLSPDYVPSVFVLTKSPAKRRAVGSLQKFPKDLRKKWEAAVRRERFTATRSSVLCSEHLKKEDFDRTGPTVRPRDGVIPSINNFPVHLQRPKRGRPTSASRKADESLSVTPQDDPEALNVYGEPNLHHPVCGRHLITGRPNANPDHPDFGPFQPLGPETARPAVSLKRAADRQARYHRAVRRRLLHSGPQPETQTDIEANQEEEENQDNRGQCHHCETLHQEVCEPEDGDSGTDSGTDSAAPVEPTQVKHAVVLQVEPTQVKHAVVLQAEPTQVKHAVVLQDHDYAGQPPPDPVEELLDKIKELEFRLKNNTGVQTQLSRFCVSDEDFQYYTRFSSEHCFKFFWKSIQPSASKAPHWSKAQKLGLENVFQDSVNPPSKLPLIDELFLYCLRTAAGLEEKVLATMFDLSVSTVSRILITWANYLYLVLGSLPVWMTQDQVRRAMTLKLQRTCPRVRVILDCFALQCESPASIILRSESDSTDKFQTTLKGLVGVSPSGQVTFVSALYKRSISTNEVTRLSGIVHLLEQGDEVMAGKDFRIEDVLATVGAKQVPLRFPLKDREKPLFKRITCQIKEFHIFDSSIPLNLAGCINQIWVTSCLLLNYLGPMELDDKQ